MPFCEDAIYLCTALYCRYLNERLVFGMAPDHIADVMTQRLRWAMGALQILMRDNPLRLVRGGWCVYEGCVRDCLGAAEVRAGCAADPHERQPAAPGECLGRMDVGLVCMDSRG